MNISPLSGILSDQKEKILACVHCGLCLEACPTYLATGDENDSPRGRIYLMRAVDEGRLQPDSKAFENHINRCLGCRACEKVCPAGVEYGNLLEGARFELKTNKAQRGIAYLFQSWLLRYIWLYPKRLQVMFATARIIRELKLPAFILKTRIPSLLWPRAAFALALLDGSAPAGLTLTKNKGVEKEEINAAIENGHPVMLFKGCVTEGLFRRVNEATKRVLKLNKYDPHTPPKQVCCGALHAHSGDLEGARELARRNVDAFETGGEILIITNAGGCGAMLSNYGHLLADDSAYAERARSFSERVRDVSQVLPNDLVPTDKCQIADPITYDASCHLLYGQHAADASLRMLLSAPGVNYVPLEGSEVCCGGAGIYNILEPELSSRVLREKLNNIQKSGAKILATGNPGCHMQIRAGNIMANKGNLKVFHPVEILDESYRCAGLYEGQ